MQNKCCINIQYTNWVAAVLPNLVFLVHYNLLLVSSSCVAIGGASFSHISFVNETIVGNNIATVK